VDDGLRFEVLATFNGFSYGLKVNCLFEGVKQRQVLREERFEIIDVCLVSTYKVGLRKGLSVSIIFFK